MPIPTLTPLYLPILGATGALITMWCIAVPRIAISILMASLVAGQLIRFPIPGQGGGILLSDIAVVLVLIAAFPLMMRFYMGFPMTAEKSKRVI